VTIRLPFVPGIDRSSLFFVHGASLRVTCSAGRAVLELQLSTTRFAQVVHVFQADFRGKSGQL
jgi:hypothetical protein